MNKIVFVACIAALILLINSCQAPELEVNIEPVIQKYLYVWNGGSVDSLDQITSEKFELRINPDFKPVLGRDSLKAAVSNTRNAFPDFTINPGQVIMLNDTAAAITWTMTGTLNKPSDPSVNGRRTESAGFSILFFNDDVLTGEWIAFSDLTWFEGLGYELAQP